MIDKVRTTSTRNKSQLSRGVKPIKLHRGGNNSRDHTNTQIVINTVLSKQSGSVCVLTVIILYCFFYFYASTKKVGNMLRLTIYSKQN